MEPSTNLFETITRGIWQWKSNSNSWSQTEEPKWESYSLQHNFLIEKAYYDQQKEVNLGEYLVYPFDLVQRKKEKPEAQRPIRRVNWVDDEETNNDRSERYFETELPKTINKIFGSLEDFIRFFSKRNSSMLAFQREFEIFEQSNDLNGLKSKILPRLIFCLEEELIKPTLEKLKDPSLSSLQRKVLVSSIERSEGLISLFQKDFLSIEEFYEKILKAYTMNTCLYGNLNGYLRNESWIEIDNLLPYVFCLCKAFFSIKPNEPEIQEKNAILLYRGTALDENALKFYDNQTSQRYFSWNSVTSTSTSRKVAQGFMYKSADLTKKKYPVLFIIEVPVPEDKTKSEDVKWIDVRSCSAMPAEDEVILAPGSVFELIECSKDKDNISTIKLKLKNEVKSLAYEGMIMQGALHGEMMTEREVKIMCLEGEELSEALKSICGNKLIEEVEFCLCTFDKKSEVVMMKILPTMEKVKALKFISCVSNQDTEEEVKIEDGCNVSKIEISETNDFCYILNKKYWKSLRELKMNFRMKRIMNDEGIPSLASNALQHLTQLLSLELNFESCDRIRDEGVCALSSHGLQYLTQLKSLALSFLMCTEITDKGVNFLACIGLKTLTELTSLTLNFATCTRLTNEAVSLLMKNGLRHLIKLTSLTLNFSWNEQINDEGIQTLTYQGLKYFDRLTSLAFNFKECKQITDKGVKILLDDGLGYLSQLTSLTLNFKECHKITEVVLNNFVSHRLRNLTQLTFLNLDFEVFRKLANQEKDQFSSEIRKCLPQLVFLQIYQTVTQNLEQKPQGPLILKLALSRTLNKPLSSGTCDSQKERSNQEISHDEKSALQSLKAFGHSRQPFPFALEFFASSIITDDEMKKLVVCGLHHLVHLKSLTLNFCACSQITDKGISNLVSQGFKYLIQLTFLSLDFSMCDKITDQGIDILCKQGLQHLSELSSLTLIFEWQEQLTDEGVEILACKGLKHLNQLVSLTLGFKRWGQLTDQGIESLANEGLKYLAQLTSLALDFTGCDQITDAGMKSLVQKGLKFLTKLTSLALSFRDCERITDEGLNILISQGLKPLVELKHLTLDFSDCEITQFTICNVIRVLRYFGFNFKQ